MKVGIIVSREDFFYDIHSLVKAFFPDDDVSIKKAGDASENDSPKAAPSGSGPAAEGVEKAAEGAFLPKLESSPESLTIEVTVPDYEDRAAAKDEVKKDLYDALCAYTGHELPWGCLSGIRPVKIAMKALNEGLSGAAAESLMREKYFVSEEKARLAARTARREKELLDSVPKREGAFSLYAHVPFCPSICLYCTFSTSPISAWKKRADEYIDTMLREMKRSAGEGRPAPSTVYIGGGTPTSLEPYQLERLLSGMQEIYSPPLMGEFTVEAGRPDSITKEKLEVLKRYGATRISVNPQTMQQKTLDEIGRRHTPEDTVRAFYLAREAGFNDINMDIILGLPGEGAREVEDTCRKIEELNPDSFTVHSLALKRASRLVRELKEKPGLSARGTYEGLSLENSSEIMAIAHAAAERMGMEPYYLYRQKNMRGGLENTGFARRGHECIYNILIMEETEDIRAFGAAASDKSVYPDGRIERRVNVKDVALYIEREKDREAQKQ